MDRYLQLAAFNASHAIAMSTLVCWKPCLPDTEVKGFRAATNRN